MKDNKEKSKKVVVVKDESTTLYDECPTCKVMLRFSDMQKKVERCPFCNQVLEWEEIE